MPDNASKTEPLTAEQEEIKSIILAQKINFDFSDLSYLELAVVFGKRVIRSKVSKARLFIEVKPGQWDYPQRLDPNESKLAHNPRLTRKDLDYLDEMWDALGW
ncbi:MAG: hypothetical protein SOR95_10375 [Sutterella sp.]|nr:hypothetical protein [Sutterella sp.]